MKRPSPLAAAKREWMRIERLCAERIKDGHAFMQDSEGELRLFAGRPVLHCGFALAWEARRRLEQLCAAESKPVPPPMVSEDYREWSSLDAMAELMLTCWDGLSWQEMKPDFLINYGDDVGQVRTIAPVEE